MCCDGTGPHTTNCKCSHQMFPLVALGLGLSCPLSQDHRKIEVGRDFDCLTSYSKQGQPRGQTNLLGALSSKVLKTSKDGDCVTSLVTCSTDGLF